MRRIFRSGAFQCHRSTFLIEASWCARDSPQLDNRLVYDGCGSKWRNNWHEWLQIVHQIIAWSKLTIAQLLPVRDGSERDAAPEDNWDNRSENACSAAGDEKSARKSSKRVERRENSGWEVELNSLILETGFHSFEFPSMNPLNSPLPLIFPPINEIPNSSFLHFHSLRRCINETVINTPHFICWELACVTQEWNSVQIQKTLKREMQTQPIAVQSLLFPQHFYHRKRQKQVNINSFCNLQAAAIKSRAEFLLHSTATFHGHVSTLQWESRCGESHKLRHPWTCLGLWKGVKIPKVFSLIPQSHKKSFSGKKSSRFFPRIVQSSGVHGNLC